MDFSSFDIYTYLDSNGINYTEKGKNISKKFIGISCPFCNDSSNHLGIHKYSKAFTCWKCGTKGNILKLIQEINQVSSKEALQLFYQHQDQTLEYLQYIQSSENKTGNAFEFPKGISKNFAGIFMNYLKKRNFSEEIIKTYDLYTGEILSEQQYRIIIPIYFNKEIVTFLSRDVTGLSPLKYINCPIEKSKRSIKDCLYNLDSVSDKAIIVEGVTDVWRLGKGAVATFGTMYTLQQIHLLKGLKQVFIFNDADANDKAEKLANSLSCFIDSVEILQLNSGDPAELDTVEALKLKKFLGF